MKGQGGSGRGLTFHCHRGTAGRGLVVPMVLAGRGLVVPIVAGRGLVVPMVLAGRGVVVPVVLARRGLLVPTCFRIVGKGTSHSREGHKTGSVGLHRN